MFKSLISKSARNVMSMTAVRRVATTAQFTSSNALSNQATKVSACLMKNTNNAFQFASYSTTPPQNAEDDDEDDDDDDIFSPDSEDDHDDQFAGTSQADFNQSSKSDVMAQRVERSIFVANLPYTVEADEMADIFSSVGPVNYSKLIRFPEGTSKGCGFVEFETREQAADAIERLNGHVVGGRAIVVKTREFNGAGPNSNTREPRTREFTDRRNQNNDCKLFIGNLSWDATEDNLRQHFGDAMDSVKYLTIKQHHDGKSRGFGFIEFNTPEEAADAIDSFDSTNLMGRKLVVQKPHTN